MDLENEIKRVLKIEAEAISAVEGRIDDTFKKAVEIISKCRGKVIVIGIGKSGLIGNKISATFSSTGTPSMFLHPVEAVHGDIGIIMKDDCALVLSQSGETEEILEMLPPLKSVGVPVISITGKKDSTLAKKSDCVLDSSVKEEACPMGLAPTASTAVQLAIGDALAVSLLKLKDFKKEDFAKLHPGGALGKKLVLKVKDLMHTGEEVPVVRTSAVLKDGLFEITDKRFGCTSVVDSDGKLAGIFTDGDLRRLLEKSENPFTKKMEEIMIKNPKTVSGEDLVINALNKMENSAITALVIVDNEGRPEGIIHLHDIVKSGVM